MLTLTIDREAPEQPLIEQAVDTMLDGGIVAYPTDTLYGLGCDATNAAAVARLCEIKGRNPDEPLPVIVNHRRVLRQMIEDIPAETESLLNRFWPGALTVVFRRRGEALRAVAPHGTLGVRIPDSTVALTLARRLHRPLVATSANRHGRPPLSTPDEIARDFAEQIDLVIDSGPIPDGVASTVLDLSGERPLIRREGAIAADLLRRYLPDLGP